MTAEARSSLDPASSELRLPRAPGVIRRFWARHPRLTDVIVALLTALVTFPAPGRAGLSGDDPLWTGLRPVVVVVLTLACVAMLWRRRCPLVSFSLAALGALLAVSSGSGVGSGTTAVAVYAVAVYAGSSAAWISSGIAIGATTLAAGIAVLVGVLPWSTAVNGCAALAVGLLVGCLVGVNIGNRARYVAALMETSRQLWAERAQHAVHAAAAERARIAREMHDVVSHSLTVMVALAEGATATDDAVRARAATAQIAATGRGALTQMRAMLGVLRSGDADDAPLGPLDGDTVRDAVTAARSAGIPVVLRTTGGEIADLPVRLAVARVVQEGLTNVIRHAPSAQEVIVSISSTASEVVVEVVNDGVHGAVSRGGYGIRGLQERAAQVGGVAEAGRRPDGRWHVRLTLPASAERTPA
ncbi:ATP-binding protein [Microbacterium laevaniformans]|uniref:histidine kinase n=1 Tax=Microbacterium laevaniformans TaxID=36807 RepID=A0A4V3RK21_9MICO|nr:sensor histidine kinase [Microbacterium laevaniformans]TGY38140.1 ATP-binding protein [Microbacterium laevaniformans]